jgi:hypothetical protein
MCRRRGRQCSTHRAPAPTQAPRSGYKATGAEFLAGLGVAQLDLTVDACVCLR